MMTQEHAALVALVAEWQEITREFREAGDAWKSAQARRWRRAVDALLAFRLQPEGVTTSAMVVTQPSDHNYAQAALAAAPAGDPDGPCACCRESCSDGCRCKPEEPMGKPGSPACAEHGDPLVCIACEQAENARPEWQPAGDPVGEPGEVPPSHTWGDVYRPAAEPKTIAPGQPGCWRCGQPSDGAFLCPACVLKEPVWEPEPSEARLMQTMCGEWMRAIPVVDLPADAARILRENLWQLYEGQPIAPPPAPAAGDVELVAGAINDAVTKWTKTPTDQRERFDVILAALRRI
jgi:hypothetical protein